MYFASKSRTLTGILAVATFLPLLPARSEPTATAQVPGLTLNSPTDLNLAPPLAPTPFSDQFSRFGVAKTPPVTLLEELRALRDDAQSALKRAEQNAKKQAATVSLPQDGKAKPNTLLEKLRVARDTAQAALYEFQESPQGLKEGKEWTAASIAWSKELRRRNQQETAEWAKIGAENQKKIEANQQKIDALSKQLDDRYKQSMKAYAENRAESARLQKHGDETNRRAAAADKAAQREIERSRRIDEWLKKKSSVKKASFGPLSDSPRNDYGAFSLRPLALQSDDCGVGTLMPTIVHGRLVQLDRCQEAQQAKN